MSPQLPRRGKQSPIIPRVEVEASLTSQTDETLHQVMEQMEERILHHSDRPEVELKILAFLANAYGPTTEGIAREMKIPVEAAAIHLKQLHDAARIWGQPTTGGEMSWHLSQEGQRFSEDRGSF